MTDLQTAIDPTTDVEALILDWAGTVVDFGSFAPTSIFVEAFARAYDFPVTLDEARQPMGLGKWDHIAALGRLPSVDARWQDRFGHPMSHAEVDHIYHTFMPLQIAAVTRFAAPIPGVLPVLDALRGAGAAYRLLLRLSPSGDGGAGACCGRSRLSAGSLGRH